MSQNRVVATAVAATAASTLLVAGILFYFVYRFTVARQRERDKQHNSSFRREMTPSVAVTHEEFMQNGGILRGLIVDENGRDVLYLRKAQGGRFTSCFSKVWFNPINEEEEKEMDGRELKPSSNSIGSPVPEIPRASSHHHNYHHDAFDIPGDHQAVTLMDHPPKQTSGLLHFTPPPPPLVIPPKQSPPPPPLLVRKTASLNPSTPQPPLLRHFRQKEFRNHQTDFQNHQQFHPK
nr:formin-like protein 8 [Coffea arabica]